MGSKIAQQCLPARLLDEVTVHLVLVVLGRGVRLFDDLDRGSHELSIVRAVDAPGVTHMTYRVVK